MKEKIKPTNLSDLKRIVHEEIELSGNSCSLNFLDISKIRKLNDLFSNTLFNGDISQWDTSNVEDMTYLFANSKFNGDISNWNVSKVKNMYGMFYASEFNQDISKWDVSNVKNMSHMFSNSRFNQDISRWDVSNVVEMLNIFNKSKFNKKLTQWKPLSLHDKSGAFTNKYITPYWALAQDTPQAVREYIADKKYQKLSNMIEEKEEYVRKLKI